MTLQRKTPMPPPREPMRRNTPLRSTAGLQPGQPLRRSELRPVSRKREQQNRERTKALRPLREAQQWCSRCGQTGVGLDAHEVRSRARGGSITDLENIRLLCRPCHDLITREPLLAKEEGWAA